MRYLMALLSMLTLCSARAELHVVNVGGQAGQVFSPQELTISLHDSVYFTNKGGLHNVVANDHSFRCADGCDGAVGSGEPSTSPWHFVQTFDTAGDVAYYCEEHGSPFEGMYGIIHVQAVTPVRLLSFGVD